MKKKSVETTEPISKMAALLEKREFTPRPFFKGERVEGIIVSRAGDSYLIDIGAKSEGLIPIKELEEEQKGVKVGDKVSVNVGQTENDSGTIILTVKAGTKDKVWLLLHKALDNQDTLDVKAIEANKGGLIVDFQDTRGFIPSSHLLTNAKDAIGKKLSVKTIEVNKSLNKLVFSEKEVSGEAFPKIDLPFKVGDKLDVTINKILPFGLLVSIKGGGEGLIHISEISWTRVESLENAFKPSEKIKAKVISIDSSNGRINLSIKQLEKDPWQEAAKKYEVGKEFERPVSRIAGYGVFVSLEDGIEGLLHSSKIPYGRVFKPGENIKISIDLFDTSQRRVALRLATSSKSEDNTSKERTRPKEAKVKKTPEAKKESDTKAKKNKIKA